MIRLNWRKVVTMLNLAALEYRACRGRFILLHENGMLLRRFALPCAGWRRKAQRAPAYPLSHSQSKQKGRSNARQGTLSLLEPYPPRRVAERYWGGPVWHL